MQLRVTSDTINNRIEELNLVQDKATYTWKATSYGSYELRVLWKTNTSGLSEWVSSFDTKRELYKAIVVLYMNYSSERIHNIMITSSEESTQ